MSTRVSADDLAFAAEVLSEYDGDDAETLAKAQRVVVWLREQAKQRRDAALVRAVAKKVGKPPSVVRAKLKKKGVLG